MEVFHIEGSHIFEVAFLDRSIHMLIYTNALHV